MRIGRWALWIGGSLGATGALVFLVAFFPAAAAVTRAERKAAAGRGPVPETFARLALCAHPNGVSHIAACRLLQAEGRTGGRAINWAVRHLVWTKAVDWLSRDAGMTLFTSSLTRASKPLAELTPEEVIDLLAADLRPDGPPPELVARLRENCLPAR